MEWFAGLVETELGLGPILVRLLAALILGGIIGLEREILARPAGLRTHMMVAVAAATFTIVAIELVHRELASSPGLSLDPTRVIEAVTAGVAFLAAGTIIQSRGRVEGLTTGAGLWLAGAVGTACGIGLLGIALIATLLGLAILGLLLIVERYVPRRDPDPDDSTGKKSPAPAKD